jgi:hypothetical protein
MCKEMKAHTLSAAQNHTLIQYATTLGYKEATLCQSVTQFLHEADFFKAKKGNTGVKHPKPKAPSKALRRLLIRQVEQDT